MSSCVKPVELELTLLTLPVVSCLEEHSRSQRLRSLVLVSTKNGDLCPDPIFRACTEYSFRILSQSDLPDLT